MGGVDREVWTELDEAEWKADCQCLKMVLVTTLMLQLHREYKYNLLNKIPFLFSFSKDSIMAIVENWMPPSRENWELVVYCFQFFPLVS